LFPVSARREDGVGGGKRNFAIGSQTGGDGNKRLLGNTNFEKAIGKRLLESGEASRFIKIGGESNNTLIGLPYLNKGFAKAVTARFYHYVFLENLRGKMEGGIEHIRFLAFRFLFDER